MAAVAARAVEDTGGGRFELIVILVKLMVKLMVKMVAAVAARAVEDGGGGRARG